eukprot:241216-Amphidinium_carterae.1
MASRACSFSNVGKLDQVPRAPTRRAPKLRSAVPSGVGSPVSRSVLILQAPARASLHPNAWKQNHVLHVLEYYPMDLAKPRKSHHHHHHHQSLTGPLASMQVTIKDVASSSSHKVATLVLSRVSPLRRGT